MEVKGNLNVNESIYSGGTNLLDIFAFSGIAKNYTYEVSFNEVLEVLQRFTVATNITAITAYNVATLNYSIDGAADVLISLPFAGTISLTANQRIVWKITYTASPTLAVLNLTATEL